MGYVKKAGSGHVDRWRRRKDPDEEHDPVRRRRRWAFSKVIDGVGPVSSAVVRLQSRNLSTNWVFFGTGRYFFEIPATGTMIAPEIDDGGSQRRLFGVKEPCFTTNNTINPECTTTVTSRLVHPGRYRHQRRSDGYRRQFSGVQGLVHRPGRRRQLHLRRRGAAVQRGARDHRPALDHLRPGVLHDLQAVRGRMRPRRQELPVGGRLQYGGHPRDAVLKGKALVQVSTASVEQLDLSTAFQGDATLHRGGRRTGAIEGVPPTSQGLSLLTSPPPVRRILHMIER